MDNFQARKWQKQRGYRSFTPSLIDRPWRIESPQVLEALSRADRQIGRLDMFSEHVPNLNLFVQMHVAKEATKSSKIEGTQTEIGEAILPEEEIQLERRDDWREVNNYIDAMEQSIAALESLPFSTRLLRDAHHKLLRQNPPIPTRTRGGDPIVETWIDLRSSSFPPPLHPANRQCPGRRIRRRCVAPHRLQAHRTLRRCRPAL